VNQLYDVSKKQSIPLKQAAGYIREKLEEKQKIEEQIKEADTVLQSKNVSIQAINEHLQLNEKLKEHGLFTQDIDKLLDLLVNAKRYGFGGKEIAAKLYNQELEWKGNQLKEKCKKLSKRISKYKDVVPLTGDIAALGIGIDELLALKVGIKQAAKL
jgi:arginine deiminase